MSHHVLAQRPKLIGVCKMTIRLQKHFYSVPSNLRGMVIKTKYIGPTDKTDSRVKAIHKRDSEKTFSKTILWDNNLEPPDTHYEAALALIKTWPMQEYNPEMKISSMGWDHDFYYFVVV